MSDELTPQQQLQLARLHAIAEKRRVKLDLAAWGPEHVELFDSLAGLYEAIDREHGAVLERLAVGC